MTHLEKLAFRHACALGTAEVALKAIRLIAESGTAPAWRTILGIVKDTEAEIARCMKEGPGE